MRITESFLLAFAAALLATAGPAPGESTRAQDLTALAQRARESVVLLTVYEPGGRAIGCSGLGRWPGGR